MANKGTIYIGFRIHVGLLQYAVDTFIAAVWSFVALFCCVIKYTVITIGKTKKGFASYVNPT